MGMYDTVHYRCPVCGEITEEQTKRGACLAQVYHAYPDGSDLPASLMTILAEDQKTDPITCAHCGNKFRLQLVNTPMALVTSVLKD